jgi:predicted metal-dependent phosphoesterase TrpH
MTAMNDRIDGDEHAPRFGVADLHVHTAFGDGMSHATEVLNWIERRTELDVVAITDHDDIGGALLARELHAAGSYHFDFVPGIEVTTRSGHLLALWVDQPVPSFRPLRETVATIHRLGGLAIIPHPFSYLTRSIGRRKLEQLLREDDAETRPDAIELANPSLAGRVTRAKARRYNEERYGLAEVGSSDAHFIEEIGTARTLFSGTGAEALRADIKGGRTHSVMADPVPLRSIGVRRLLAQQARGLSVTPRKVLGRRLRRLAGVLTGGSQ